MFGEFVVPTCQKHSEEVATLGRLIIDLKDQRSIITHHCQFDKGVLDVRVRLRTRLNEGEHSVRSLKRPTIKYSNPLSLTLSTVLTMSLAS